MEPISLRLMCVRITLLLLVSALVPVSAGAQWTKLSVPATNPTPAIYAARFFDKDTGFVCGVAGSTPTGRLYLTVNGGTSWTQVALPGTPRALNDIFFLPGGRFGVVVGDGGYVAVTADRGVNWTQRSVAIGAWTSGVDINGVYFKDTLNGFVVGNVSTGGSGPRFARTTDGGVSWGAIAQNDPPANNLYDIGFFDAQRGVVVGTGAPPRKSRTTDGGNTWSAYDSVGIRASSSLSMFGLDLVPGTGIGYAAGGRAFATPYFAEVRRTTDYGATWSQTGMNGSVSGYAFPASDVAAVTDSLLFVIGWNANIHRSLNAGSSWRVETLPSTVATSVDFRKLSFTRDNRLFAVGTAGTILRLELIPDARFSPATGALDFFSYCLGDQVADESLVVYNDGDGPLRLEDLAFTQPSGGVTFQIVGAYATTINPGSGTQIRIHPIIPPGTAAGTYTGALRIRTNDENGRGADTLKSIALTIRVRSQVLTVDPAVSRDAGRVRVTGMIQSTLTMKDLLLDTSECAVRVDSVALAVGTDFTLSQVTRQTLPARAGRLTIETYFLPRAVCARYDTLIVYSTAPGSPYRIPIVGTGVLPTFALKPSDTLDLGRTGVGRPLNGMIELHNDAPGVCHDSSLVTGFRLAGPNVAEFTVSFTAGRSIPAGDKLSVPVSASPAGPGRRIAYAIFKSEVYGDLQDTVVLLMEGLEANFGSTRSEVIFDTTDVGGQRDTALTAFLVNFGSLPVRVDSIVVIGGDKGSFQYLAPTLPMSVTNGGPKGINLCFLATKVGRLEATLGIYTDLAPKPTTVTLIGYGALPVLGVRSRQVVFEQTAVNTCRDTLLSRFIHNPSPAPLRIRAVRIAPSSGADPNDTLAFNYVAPAIPPDLVIEAWDSAQVMLRFCPKHTGVHRAELTFGSNASGASPAITLIGNGQSGSAVSIDTIRFQRTRVLMTRDTVVERLIFNAVGGDIRIDSITVTGADALSFTRAAITTPFLLAPTRDTALGLRFNPMRRGDHFAFLNIHTSQGPHTVVLAGRAAYPFLKVAPRSLADLRVRPGGTRRITFDILNAGDDSARIDGAAITGDPAFTNPSTGSFPRTLPPDERISLDIDFTPAHPCEHPARIAIRGEGVQGVYGMADTVVQVAGIGVLPLVSSRREEILFGTRSPGSTNDSTLVDFVGAVDFSGVLSICLDTARIDSIAITGAGASAFTLLSPVDPGSSRTLPSEAFLPLAISFRPTAPGLSSAELRIFREGSADSTLTIRLVGAAANLAVGYGPAPNMIELDFGKVHRGWVVDSLFTLSALGSDPIPIDMIAADPSAEFRLTSPANIPGMLAPGAPATVGVSFTSADPLGARRAVVRVRSGSLEDSIFVLRATVADDQLRAPALVEFGARSAGSVVDTAAVLVNEPTAAIPDRALLADAPISDVVIVSGQGSFVVVGRPARIPGGGRDSIILGFRPSGGAGPRSGTARIYFNDHDVDGTLVRDSADVQLRGAVAGVGAALEISLGPDQTGIPGDVIRAPIILGGAGASIGDTISLVVSYDRALLRPLRVTPRRDGIGGSFSGPLFGATRRGTTEIVIGGAGALLPGTLADLEMEVLLGDTLESAVAIDTALVAGHPEIPVARTGMRFTVNGYCDADGRRIRFDLGPTLKSTPNPLTRQGKIEYVVPAITNVRLALYDALGREVARLADGPAEPGIYSVPLDAGALPSGLYHCLLVTGRFSTSITIQVTE